MKADRLIITPRACADLEEIHGSISMDSPEKADAMVQRILDAIKPLEQFPSRMVAQVQHPGLREPVRRLPVNPYIVYFRWVERNKAVEMLHVRHGARRQPKRFK